MSIGQTPDRPLAWLHTVVRDLTSRGWDRPLPRCLDPAELDAIWLPTNDDPVDLDASAPSLREEWEEWFFAIRPEPQAALTDRQAAVFRHFFTVRSRHELGRASGCPASGAGRIVQEIAAKARRILARMSPPPPSMSMAADRGPADLEPHPRADRERLRIHRRATLDRKKRASDRTAGDPP